MLFSTIIAQVLIFTSAATALRRLQNDDDPQVNLTSVVVSGNLTGGVFSPCFEPSEDTGGGSATVTIINFVVNNAMSGIIQTAVSYAIKLIENLIEWNGAREAFTKETTRGMMMNGNLDYKIYPAAVCYNQQYTMVNGNNKDGLTTVEFAMTVMKTDYDCMYLMSPNTFEPYGDGGFVNLAYFYNAATCTFDDSTLWLTCQ